MNGIKRLRNLAKNEMGFGFRGAHDVLASIADQIERELREALGGRDEEVTDVATIHKDAYDAYEWVFEHGGLDAVKRDAACWNTAENIAQTTLGWLARVCPVAGIEKCGYGVALEKLEDAINRRLMPESMEWLLEVWPKWSNGEYCKFGDWWTADKYGDYEPRQLRRLAFYTPEQLREWEQDEGDNFGYEWDFMRPSDTTYRPDKVEPPSPKVLDADGAEIRVGDTVYSTRESESGTVVYAYPPGDDGQPSVKVGAFWHHASELTHRAPVLAADGRPLREGETVWSTDSGIRYTVEKTTDELIPIKCCSVMGSTVSLYPSQLTHERPEIDSWERLEEDAKKPTCDYFGHVGGETCETCPGYADSSPQGGRGCRYAHMADIVRRARALAGDA